MSDPIESIKRYEFKRVIENLEGKKGQATELITIYIPPDKQISDVTSQLRDEYNGQAANIKSKSTRTNVQSALSSIMSPFQQLSLSAVKRHRDLHRDDLARRRQDDYGNARR